MSVKSNNLDAIFVATNAPGLSAYNVVERRMAPLSHDLAGIILPHDTYGTHLSESGKIIDEELAKRNFAGEALASVWQKTVIDGHPVIAKFSAPDEIRPPLTQPDEEWKAAHVRQSQYCLQIVRCTSISCCGKWRTNLLDLLPDRFLPAPITFSHSANGICITECDSDRGRFGSLYQRIALCRLQPNTDFKMLPFDFYCVSIHDQLGKRVCNQCGLYFPSQVALKQHMVVHNRTVFMDEKDNAPQKIVQKTHHIPVLDNIYVLMQSPFEDDEVEY